MEHKEIHITLKVWRQQHKKAKGYFEEHKVKVSTELSFLEMLDLVNEGLLKQRKEPIAFDHDCREGICGTCGVVINGQPHGPWRQTTTCQLHMRAFRDGEVVVVEPFRANAFPVIKDLIVDRSAFDKIIQAGGFVSVRTGNAVEANTIPVPKEDADAAFAAAACIGCGACVAVCKNASASLFVSAKVAHLAHLPQGRVEAKTRVRNMIAEMDKLNFGACSNTGACEAECPKGISLVNIAKMNKEYIKANLG